MGKVITYKVTYNKTLDLGRPAKTDVDNNLGKYQQYRRFVIPIEPVEDFY